MQQDAAGALGMSPRLNSLESLFDKEGLGEFGARGLKEGCVTASTNRPYRGSWHE